MKKRWLVVHEVKLVVTILVDAEGKEDAEKKWYPEADFFHEEHTTNNIWSWCPETGEGELPEWEDKGRLKQLAETWEK